MPDRIVPPPPPPFAPMSPPPPPFPVEAVPVARPVNGIQAGPPQPVRGPTEPLAVFSAVCGLTAVIPIVSQVVGLVLGVVSLGRIRRAKKHGVQLSGMGWTMTGLISSAAALAGWIGFFVVIGVLQAHLSESASALSDLARHTTP